MSSSGAPPPPPTTPLSSPPTLPQHNPIHEPTLSHRPPDLGTFSPSMSLRFFKQGSEGRVRAATEQENFGVDDQNPHMAGALVKAAIILQSGILAFFIVTMSTGDGKAPGEMDAERMLAYHPAGTFDEVGDALGDGTLQVYVAVALLPYMRMLCYVVLLSSTTKSFGLQEIVSMSILLLSQIFRAASDDEHRGRMNLINPLYIKIVLIFVDLTLCFCCGCLKTRINKLNFNDKEIFVYKLLPTCLVAMIVPCAYLTSESASCWVPNNHGDWNDTTETCHNIFVSNNALSYAFVGSGFLYLVMTPFLTKHYSLRNLVSFNFPFFRTYIQIIFFLCATISALFMFSTAREIAADTFAPGTKEENIKFYFDTKFPLFVLWFLKLSMDSRIALTNFFIQATFFLLIVSSVFPLPIERIENQNSRELQSVVSGIELTESTRPPARVGYKISRFLKSKLMTRRLDELAPFYRYLTLVTIFIIVQTLLWEVGFRRELFSEAWKIYNHYVKYDCSDEGSVCACNVDRDQCYPPPYVYTGDNYANRQYNDYNFQLFYQCTRDDGTYFMSDYISLSCDYDLRLDMTALNPTGHYYWATRKCLLVNSCMNMCCLVFLGLLVLSRPSAKFHLFADGIAITYILFSHACLFYNCNIVINEDKRFAHDISTDSRGIPAFEFFGVIYSFACFVGIFVIGRLCRTYLAAHTENEVNLHMQRSLVLFMSSLPPSFFLLFEARYCGSLVGASSPSCSMLAQGNFAVVVNIVMGVTFFSLFNFSFPDLELEDFLKVSDKIQNFDVVFRFILMGILQFVAMIIFGFRPRDAGDQKEMNNSITDQSRMQNYALDIFTPVLPCVWSLLFIVYFFKLGHDEHVEKVIGEEDDDVEEGSIENGEDALFTMWTVVLRYSGDLLIPVSLLYFSVHFMSDLSHPEVRLRTTIPLTGIALLFMVDTATFFEQPEEYKQKSAYTEDKGGSTWFGKQLIVCVSVVLLLLLIVVRKKSCLQLSEEKRRKHLFDNVACIALSTFSTLTYLISEYFSCATRLINKELYKLKHDEETELTDMTRGDIVKLFIDKNQCEAISYNLTPLVLMMVFTAIGKIIYPEASEDFPLKRIMTLNLPRFRIFQLVVGTIMAMTAIVMFGLRHESRIDPWVETFTTVYFVLTLFMFIVEGFYSTLFAKIRAGGNEEFEVNFDKNGGPSLRINRSSLQMRNLVGSEKSIWNGGTKGRHKGLEKDRTKTGLSTTSHSDNELKMGAGVLGENSLAPGML
ncbi:hypothetical protein TrLO_g163 [Triparma laevis f. longispina]|uniref:Uncharacterized protein n=1 Tax=Triparma laevis f. longispina TaxID=1714387 RepID=A0A9W6ZLA1_9STRA|nr:hypothetical protein TrLO_g163 [Triparma laevis f. longispina]